MTDITSLNLSSIATFLDNDLIQFFSERYSLLEDADVTLDDVSNALLNKQIIPAVDYFEWEIERVGYVIFTEVTNWSESGLVPSDISQTLDMVFANFDPDVTMNFFQNHVESILTDSSYPDEVSKEFTSLVGEG